MWKPLHKYSKHRSAFFRSIDWFPVDYYSFPTSNSRHYPPSFSKAPVRAAAWPLPSSAWPRPNSQRPVSLAVMYLREQRRCRPGLDQMAVISQAETGAWPILWSANSCRSQWIDVEFSESWFGFQVCRVRFDGRAVGQIWELNVQMWFCLGWCYCWFTGATCQFWEKRLPFVVRKLDFSSCHFFSLYGVFQS